MKTEEEIRKWRQRAIGLSLKASKLIDQFFYTAVAGVLSDVLGEDYRELEKKQWQLREQIREKTK